MIAVGRFLSGIGIKYGLRFAKRFFKSSKRTNQAKVNATQKSSPIRGMVYSGVGGYSAGVASSAYSEGTKSFKQLAILFIVVYILANRK